jgi:hypothetical protein
MNTEPAGTPRPSRDGRPARTGEEAPYTSESFEVDPDVGTDSPLGDPAPDPFVPDADGGHPVPRGSTDEGPRRGPYVERDGQPCIAQP